MRFTNLDMDALRSFAAGMDAGSFARAADRLGRSTSAVSAQLKKLEEQAGAPLVRKSDRPHRWQWRWEIDVAALRGPGVMELTKAKLAKASMSPALIFASLRPIASSLWA
jgi:hypothetical protein